MNKNALIAVLGLSVVVLLAIELWPRDKTDNGPTVSGPTMTDTSVGSSTNGPSSSTGTQTDAPKQQGEQPQPEPTAPDPLQDDHSSITNVLPCHPVVVTNTNSPVTRTEVNRLRPQTITAVSEIKGRGRYSKLCYRTSGAFTYTHTLEATSKILSRDVGDDGIVEVEEERTFGKAQELIDLDDVDVALTFERVPLEDIDQWATTVAAASAIVSMTFKDPRVIGVAKVTQYGAGIVKATTKAMNELDGESIKGQFEKRGLRMPAWLTKLITHISEREAMKRLEEVHGHVQRLEGSTYLFSYYQKESGAPMLVSYRRQDGTPLSEEEREVLDSVNVFLDARLVPDRDIAIGEEWSVDARDLQQIVGTATGGKLNGKLNLRRRQDSPSGLWEIDVLSNRIRVVDEKGRPSGAIVIAEDGGWGNFDPDGRFVRSFQIIGSGKLNVETMRKFLFVRCVTRSDGECSFRSTYVTRPFGE